MHNESFTININGEHVELLTENALDIPIDMSTHGENDYENALLLFSQTTEEWIDEQRQVDLVHESFRQRVLTPFTAFSVWETDQQERDLYSIQDNILHKPILNVASDSMLHDIDPNIFGNISSQSRAEALWDFWFDPYRLIIIWLLRASFLLSLIIGVKLFLGRR